MNTYSQTTLESPETLKPLRSLYLDVRGDKPTVQSKLGELSDHLKSALEGEEEFPLEEQKPLLDLATPEVSEMKLKEITSKDRPTYQIAQFADFYSGEDGALILRNIGSFLEMAGMKIKTNDDGSIEITIPGRDTVAIGCDGKIASCADQSCVGADALHYLSCYLKQDLAAVLKKGDRFKYAFDISVFEKTPKDTAGRNSYLGEDIVDFHSKAPNFGPMMGGIFRRIIGNFEAGNLDMLTVDLRGQNVYQTDGFARVKRFERDRFIPLRDTDGKLAGFLGVADVFFQDEEEQKSPFEGGECHKDIASQMGLLRVKLGLTSQYPLLRKYRELLAGKDRYFGEALVSAEDLNEEKFGGKMDLYGISYISDECVNDCAYCGHSTNIGRARNTLSDEEMCRDFEAVIKHAPEEFCILAGENPKLVDDCIRALKVAGEVNKACGSPLKRITFNVAPMSSEDFKRIVAANNTGLPLQYRIFQETYDRNVYQSLHTKGPKADFDFRLGAQERALEAGFDDVGVGVLLGVNSASDGHDHDIFSLIEHAYRIKQTRGKFPYSVSIPRHQPVAGYDFKTPSPVDDRTYVFYHALLRMALPETKIMITSRETPEMIRRLEPLVNIRDLAPRPGVGGNFRPTDFQNELGDARSAEEIIQDLKERMRR